VVTLLVGLFPTWWFLASAASRKQNRLRWALSGVLSYLIPALATQLLLSDVSASAQGLIVVTAVSIATGLLAALLVHRYLVRITLPTAADSALLHLIAAGHRGEAIKSVTKLSGASLSQAKAYVDRLPARSTALLSAKEPSTDAERHLELAWSYEALNAFESASRECDLALELAPDCAEAHNLRGVVLESLGRGEEAIDAYGEAVRLDPMLIEARQNLEDAEAEFGRVDPGG